MILNFFRRSIIFGKRSHRPNSGFRPILTYIIQHLKTWNTLAQRSLKNLRQIGLTSTNFLKTLKNNLFGWSIPNSSFWQPVVIATFFQHTFSQNNIQSVFLNLLLLRRLDLGKFSMLTSWRINLPKEIALSSGDKELTIARINDKMNLFLLYFVTVRYCALLFWYYIRNILLFNVLCKAHCTLYCHVFISQNQ